jgi:hypothetical protein
MDTKTRGICRSVTNTAADCAFARMGTLRMFVEFPRNRWPMQNSALGKTTTETISAVLLRNVRRRHIHVSLVSAACAFLQDVMSVTDTRHSQILFANCAMAAAADEYAWCFFCRRVGKLLKALAIVHPRDVTIDIDRELVVTGVRFLMAPNSHTECFEGEVGDPFVSDYGWSQWRQRHSVTDIQLSIVRVAEASF